MSTDGRGFVVPESEVLANTRKGKQVMNVAAPAEARLCVAAAGDHVAIIGENRKLLIFPLSRCRKCRAARACACSAIATAACPMRACSTAQTGLSWSDSSGRSFTRSLAELGDWVGDRAQAGRLPPQGFPRSNNFGTPRLG